MLFRSWGAPLPTRATKTVNDWDDAADELLNNLGGVSKEIAKRNNNADLFMNDGTRGSQGSNKEYSGFGILGKAKSTEPIFGNKRNSGANAGEEDDLLDNILDNIEEKKGIESTKPKSIHNNSFGSQNA